MGETVFHVANALRITSLKVVLGIVELSRYLMIPSRQCNGMPEFVRFTTK
jgi:hypothetical protein